MLLRSLAKLASVLLASVSVGAGGTVAVTVLTAQVSAQEGSGLSGVDCSVITAAELEGAVTAAVQMHRSSGLSDTEIAQIIGSDLKSASGSCSSAQQQALVVNVVAILGSLDLSIPPAVIQAQVTSGFGPTQTTVVASVDGPTPSLAAY